jgi:hypothetical protein
MSGTPCSIVCFLSVGFGGAVAFERARPQRQRFAAARVPWSWAKHETIARGIGEY